MTTPAVAGAADDHRRAGQLGVPAHLDAGEERVHVDVQDGAPRRPTCSTRTSSRLSNTCSIDSVGSTTPKAAGHGLVGGDVSDEDE